MRGLEPPAAGTGPQAACPAAERATGREAARSAALDSYVNNSADNLQLATGHRAAPGAGNAAEPLQRLHHPVCPIAVLPPGHSNVGVLGKQLQRQPVDSQMVPDVGCK
ncbi:hypothetical protein GCM10009530_70750 [Microbispora corallina]|uniref:Uncharacterized protein n=1 Tax=Microbispora corallina TaxID=83302 RepID=A0ABQ4GAE0_9ACTN|nr:hypothetical protein Mco01_70560 [Microbispora corallina]